MIMSNDRKQFEIFTIMKKKSQRQLLQYPTTSAQTLSYIARIHEIDLFDLFRSHEHCLHVCALFTANFFFTQGR